MIILQLSILFRPSASDMNRYVFVFGLLLQPVFRPFIHGFCKSRRNTDQEKLFIVNGMTKDVIRSIASVGYKDLLSAGILLSAEQSAEGTFFVHFPYTLKLGIQKNVI